MYRIRGHRALGSGNHLPQLVALNSENEIALGDFSVYLSCAASVMPTTKIDAEAITIDAMR
jgi:hypothetical protein